MSWRDWIVVVNLKQRWYEFRRRRDLLAEQLRRVCGRHEEA